MAPAPHYLRFARAVALVSLTTAPGCYASHLRPESVPDAALADAGPPDTAPPTCASCNCNVRVGPTSCDALGLSTCCLTLGPLPPPNLAASCEAHGTMRGGVPS